LKKKGRLPSWKGGVVGESKAFDLLEGKCSKKPAVVEKKGKGGKKGGNGTGES